MSRRSAALYVLFFLSGAAGLGFQIAWTRMFATGLGHEVPAVLAVVAAIFGGMAAGAWAGDELILRSSRPGRWYGWCELLIGAWGLLCIAVIPLANRTALSLTSLEPSAFRHWLVAFAVPGLVLLPATAAMGATFPAMARFLAARVTGGHFLGGLYAANTLGAVLGIVASTSVIVPEIGFARGLALFSGLSLLCGVIALVVEAKARRDRPSAAPGGPPRATSVLGLLVTLGATGLLGIGYEVLVVRVLAQVLENTVYSFAAVLAVYLLGTASGAALYQWRARQKIPKTGSLLLALSIAVVLGVWLLAHSQTVALWTRSVFGDTPVGVWCAEFITAGCGVLVPTVLMGATFSHLLELTQEKGVSLGRALAWNTVGCALAPLLFGVLLLPLIGSKWALIALGWAYLALAWPLPGRQRWMATVPILLVFALPHRFLVPPTGGKLLAYREGVMDSVAVLEHPDGNRSLLVNGRFTMGGTGAALAERRHASIPLLLHPNPQRALFLGLGTGITFAAAGPHPGLAADGVELVPEIVDVLPWFAPQNTLPTTSGRFDITVADARRFVQICPHRYDVIVADLFHPARDGAGALYSLEHFRALRQRLAPGGLVCQWLPLFQLDEPILRVILRTFLEVFPDTRAFLLRLNVDTPVLGLISGLQSEHFGPDYFAGRVRNPQLLDQLNAEGVRDSFHLFGSFLAGPQALRRFAADAALNTDDQPVVLFGAPKFNLDGRATPYGRLARLLELNSSELTDLLPPHSPAAIQFSRDLAAFIQARNIYLKGLIAETEGNPAAATAAFVQSSQLSPFFSTGYAQVLTLAMQQAKTNPTAARQLLEQLIAARPERPVAARLLERLSNTVETPLP